VLLPAALLDGPPSELASHRGSSMCRMLPSTAAALAQCVPHLRSGAQTDLVMLPLELLGRDWAERWGSLPAEVGEDPTRQWFCSAMFLFVSTVVRQVDFEVVAPLALVHCVRAMAHADLFRQDTQEYRALCLNVVEQGSEDAGFRDALFQALREFHEALIASSGGEGSDRASWAHLACLHFLLGVLACPALIDAEPFFPAVWPVIIDCIAAVDPKREERGTLAIRAHGLAGVCLGQVGAADRPEMVREYLSSSSGALERDPREDIGKAFAVTTETLMKDIGTQCSGGAADPEALGLQRWVLHELGSSVLENLREGRAGVAEGLFKVLCGASLYVHPQYLPYPFYRESRLHTILTRHEPMRDLWLRHLIARASEASREVLTRCLLDDFPEQAAAYPESAAAGRPRGGSTLRSAL